MKIRLIIDRLLALLFPQRACCQGCGSLLGNEQEGWLCDSCRADMDALYDLYEVASPHKLHLDRAFAPFMYLPPIDGMIRAFKYHHLPTLCQPLADALCRLMEVNGQTEYDLIVPVPLHPKRRYERGYNQALLLAQCIGARFDLPVCEALRRIRHTRQQARLSTAERTHNLDNAFACSQPVEGCKVLLVDDVLTTGTTVSLCAQALLASGARSVDVCAVAIARSKLLRRP